MSVEDRLVGSYRLLSFENFADDGEVARPFGDNPKGFAIYTAEHLMTAIMMRADRPNFADGDILAATESERVDAFATASSFAGRWEIVDDQIVHHLDVTTYPNWTGTLQYRNFELSDTHFTLFPPRMLMHGKIRRGEVRFERITGAA
jgi:hypothetical protein